MSALHLFLFLQFYSSHKATNLNVVSTTINMSGMTRTDPTGNILLIRVFCLERLVKKTMDNVSKIQFGFAVAIIQSDSHLH